MLDVLRGLNSPAILVAFARALLEIAIIGAIGAVLMALNTVDWGDYAIASPFIFAGLRWLEGVADHIDPEKKRADGSST